jgi:hypothetical protein
MFQTYDKVGAAAFDGIYSWNTGNGYQIGFGTNYPNYNLMDASQYMIANWTDNTFNAFLRTDDSNVKSRINGTEINQGYPVWNFTEKLEYYLGTANTAYGNYYNHTDVYKMYAFGSSMDLTKRNAFDTITNNFCTAIGNL